jgi:hypothetical protein
MKWSQVPQIPRYINILTALALYGFGIYHYTQPDAAWRSGTIEVVTASGLLAAVTVAPLKVAVIINLVFSVFMIGLGIRHCAIGGGWVSGSTELAVAVLLIYGAVKINKARKTGS